MITDQRLRKVLQTLLENQHAIMQALKTDGTISPLNIRQMETLEVLKDLERSKPGR